MLTVIFQVDNVSGDIQVIKESLAMLLEQWGDVKIVDVREVKHKQVVMEGFNLNEKS